MVEEYASFEKRTWEGINLPKTLRSHPR